MDRIIRVAIIGCGAIGRVHARAISQLSKAKLVAVCDVNEGPAQSMASDFGSQYYTDYHKMFATEELDLVTVCTPSGTRLDICTAAAAHKINILVEKPLDITAERCQQIVDVCEASGVKLGTIFQLRFTPVFRRLKEAVDQQRFGRLILGNAQTICYRPQSYYDSGGWRGTLAHEGGGALMNQGIHSVDLLLWMMGDVVNVDAFTGTLTHNIEVEDTVTAAVEFANGAMGSIQATTSVLYGIDKRLEIYGEKGTVIIDGETVVKWEFEDGFPLEVLDEKRIQLSASSPLIEDVQGHRDQIGDMVDAILEDREPAVSGREGKKAVDLILAIYKSAGMI